MLTCSQATLPMPSVLLAMDADPQKSFARNVDPSKNEERTGRARKRRSTAFEPPTPSPNGTINSIGHADLVRSHLPLAFCCLRR